MNQYICGQEVNLAVLFSFSVNAQPFDPAAVSAEILLPDGTVEDLTPDLVHNGAGQYSVLFIPSLNGLHQYRFSGAGGINAAAEGAFMAQTVFPAAP